MTILITGSTGKLGSELKKVYPQALSPTRNILDITNKSQVSAYFDKFKPDILIHTAAITDVRFCEDNNLLALKTNFEGTKNLIDASENLQTQPYFLYISTACVFQGDKSFYTEEDIPYPKNFYSLTKLLGETAVGVSKLSNKLIIRTNFVSKTSWPYPKAFSDRFGTYLFAEDVAAAIKEVIDTKPTGVIHICGNKRMSMYDLAKIVSPEVLPMRLNDYQGPPLTVDMSLSSLRWKKYRISKFK